MDTRRNNNYKIKFFFLMIAAVATFPVEISIVKAETSPPDTVQSELNKLKEALSDCSDNYLSSRIKYQIGLTYFKANMLDESKTVFELISKDAQCPEPVRACSLNMTGQISRLIGDNQSALDALEKTAIVLEHLMSENKESADNAFYLKLWCSVSFSKAEIFEQDKIFDKAIIEYNRLLDGLRHNKSISIYYIPLINDRLSQLYLRNGNIDKYIQQAESTTRNYPQYYRTPLIELETECVKLIMSVSAEHQFTGSGCDAPALLIGYVKDNKLDSSAHQRIASKFDELCKKNQDTYAGILLDYHYAWLLDALGDKNKAAELLSHIFQNETVDNQTGYQKELINKIRKYSTIQYAIIAGEKADYNDALRVLGGLKTDPNETHISQLAESVTESIQTLKREVPANELVQK